MSAPHYKPSIIEKIAEAVRIIPRLHEPETATPIPLPEGEPGAELKNYVDAKDWMEVEEYDPAHWPNKVKRKYMLVPTNCFNCESGCGLLAYVDKETMQVRKFEGNPEHPGSRGRNCAKGPATINQIVDPERILYPMKRSGPRGSGKFERVSWEEALTDIAARLNKALKEKRHNEITYHVGRPGHERYMTRILKAWGVDGHNSHTNICSAGARTGYALWQGYDRPSPDFSHAQFILLLSSHLETGHYFNPHAQRIIEGMMKGCKLAVLDPRLSNTASMADYWMPSYPGTEAAIFLAMAKILLEEGRYNREFMENWINWRDYMAHERGREDETFENFIKALIEDYAEFTPEFAAREAGVDAQMIRDIAAEIAKAGTAFATHTWRSATIGNEGGWAISRALHFLNVITGSVGTIGGTLPSGWQKIKPEQYDAPPSNDKWNELHFPAEYPLSHYEMSFILPHMLKEGRGKLDVYFTRVFNPVWTYPDGFAWADVLSDESLVGMHVALTPTWNETAYFADYVLPMGHSSERHDWLSYETHSGSWVGFRQPVLREAARRMGKEVEFTYETNPGEVWEEDEFWIELSWKMDPDESLGIRKHFLSPYRAGEKITVEEYYRYAFEHLPGLPEKAAAENLSPLDYMRKYGVVEVAPATYEKHEREVIKLEDVKIDDVMHVARRGRKKIGILIQDKVREGFHSPSRLQEIYSYLMVDWKWPEHRTPGYVKSHIHQDNMDYENGEMTLLPNYRLPNLIHTRSGNSKWLTEIAHKNPIWMHTSDAEKFGFETGDLIRVNTDIGYFVNRVWVTEAIKPRVIACSHHIGRWRRMSDAPNNMGASNLVDVKKENGVWKMRVVDGVRPYDNGDPDARRIYWSDGGVHQNLTHAVQPDPISGAHCWLQKVRIEQAHADDRYGDISVDSNKSMEMYRHWLAKTRPAPGPGGLRRPFCFNRPLRPIDKAFYMDYKSPE